MKKIIFPVLSLFLFLSACATHRDGTDTQIPPTLKTSIIATPLVPADSPVATTPLQRPKPLDISRLQMFDARVGWAEASSTSALDPSRSDYYLVRTMDGGETWQDVTPPTPFTTTPGQGPGISLFVIDADRAWATPIDRPFSADPSYAIVWRTVDGGKSWKPSNPVILSIPTDLKLSPWLQFVDEKHGWLTFHLQQRIESHDLQYRTRDGGVTWEEIPGCYTFDGAGQGCEVPQFTDPQTGWLINVPGRTSTWDIDPATVWRVRRTLDGGKTWQNLALPHSQEVRNCYQTFTRIVTGVVGLRMDCTTLADLRESYYYLSADRGETWRILPLPGKEFSTLSSILFYETFNPIISTTGTVFFLDMNTGWRLSATENGYQLERTTDGGETWQLQAEHLSWPDGFQFVDADHGWMATGDDDWRQLKGELQRTTDGGKTWRKLTPRLLPADANAPAPARLEAGYPPVFQSMQMNDSSSGWAIGADGYVFHTTDGGQAWQDVTPLSGQIVARREFFALDVGRAWTTVSFPSFETIWSTGDGGRSWHQLIALPERQAVAAGSIRFLNEKVGWFQSSEWNGNTQEVQLLKTRDSGVSWEVQATAQYSYDVMDRMGFLFLDEKNGFRIEPVEKHTMQEWMSDSPALISKTTDGGLTWQPVDLPDMVLDPNEMSVTQEAYPGGMQERMQDTLSCEEGITLRLFSSDTLGLRVTCRGTYREAIGTYGYVFVLREDYLSTDAGANWTNWMSAGYDIPVMNDHTLPESEFFLPGGIGWRLKANQLLQTTDGGKTWITLKPVGWEEARFDFIDAQEGWGIVKSGSAISLVHTTDGGKNWEEIKPFVVNP